MSKKSKSKTSESVITLASKLIALNESNGDSKLTKALEKDIYELLTQQVIETAREVAQEIGLFETDVLSDVSDGYVDDEVEEDALFTPDGEAIEDDFSDDDDFGDELDDDQDEIDREGLLLQSEDDEDDFDFDSEDADEDSDEDTEEGDLDDLDFDLDDEDSDEDSDDEDSDEDSDDEDSDEDEDEDDYETSIDIDELQNFGDDMGDEELLTDDDIKLDDELEDF